MDTAMPLPKYHQIYLVLREQLQEGRYDVDGVPGEHALAAQFQVARITIRKAMEMLVADGLVSRRPGLGTWPRSASRVRYRAAPARGAGADRADGEHRQHGPAHRRARAGLRQVGAPPAVAEALEIAPGEPVIKSLRVRSTEAGPCPTSPLTCRWPSQPSRARTWSASPC